MIVISNEIFLGNVKINNILSDDFLYSIDTRIKEKKKTKVNFLNAHCYNVAQKDNYYREAVNNSDYLLNDGIGVKIGSRIFGHDIVENLNGTDLTPKILKMAESSGYKVFLLGGEEGVARKAADNFKNIYSDLDIVGFQNGFFNNTEKLIEEINATNTDIVIVALGVPYQEKWIEKHADFLNCSLLIGVGAFLDFSAGKVKRAPKFIRAIKMEWFFRLLMEPKRLWKRYLIGNFMFFFNILKKKYIK